MANVTVNDIKAMVPSRKTSKTKEVQAWSYEVMICHKLLMKQANKLVLKLKEIYSYNKIKQGIQKYNDKYQNGWIKLLETNSSSK